MNKSKIENLSFRDMRLLADLPRFTSLRSFAEHEGMSTANLSKLINSIEDSVGVTLLQRSPLGITPTHECRRLSLKASELMKLAQLMVNESKREESFSFKSYLNIGARGFLNAAYIPTMLASVGDIDRNLGLRFIDLSPSEMIEATRRGSIDIALNIGKPIVGEKWVIKKLGKIEWKLYARKGHPLGVRPNLEELARFNITRASFFDGSTVVEGEDFIPIDSEFKNFGHGVQTTITALQVIKHTDHLAYLPNISVRQLQERGEIQEIRIPKMKPFGHELWIAVDQDRVSQKIWHSITSKFEV